MSHRIARLIAAVRDRPRFARPRPVLDGGLGASSRALTLPPELVEWLAFDASWLADETEGFRLDGDHLQMRAMTWARAVAECLDDEVAWRGFVSLPPSIDGWVVPLRAGSESMRVLLLRDDGPVLAVHVGDESTVSLHRLDFGVWLDGALGAGDETSADDVPADGAHERLVASLFEGAPHWTASDLADDDTWPDEPIVWRMATRPPTANGEVDDAVFVARLTDALDKQRTREVRTLLIAARERGTRLGPRLGRAVGEATLAGRLDWLDAILELGGDPNHRHTYGIPLHIAASRGVDLVHRLLAAGADPNETPDGDASALFHATKEEAPEVVNALLAAGADPNHGNGTLSPLHVLCHGSGDDDAVAICSALLAAGARSDATNASGKTVLEYAAEWDQPSLLEAMTGT